MWKAQLFDQLDRLDATKQEFYDLQSELARAQWELVELVDLERTRCETALARSQAEVHDLSKELVSSRSRVDGLKNLGTCLAAKLERTAAQKRVLQREHARLTELAETRAALLETREEELVALRAELFEARRQLLSHRLESQGWDSLKQGLHAPVATPAELIWDLAASAGEPDGVVPETVILPALPPSAEVGRRRLKLAGVPLVESQVPPLPKRLWMRAGKTVEGWFKLGSKA
jgi:hypothetical protein